MSNQQNIVTRIMAAAAAVTMSLAIIVSYVAAPHVQAVSGIVA